MNYVTHGLHFVAVLAGEVNQLFDLVSHLHIGEVVEQVTDFKLYFFLNRHRQKSLGDHRHCEKKEKVMSNINDYRV